MPFNGVFQYPNALLVESANFVITHATVYSASPGDVVVHATNSTGGASTAAIVVTLPPVGQGGPVTFKETATAGTVTIKAYETSGVYIDGTAGTTGVTPAGIGQFTYTSDGSNWWRVC